MKHTYQIHGMSCQGCRSHVEQALSSVEGVASVKVDLLEATATLEMLKHISVDELQQALSKSGGHYSISLPGNESYTGNAHHPPLQGNKKEKGGSGVYYCPMQCEGDKTYDSPGDCPVCGMALVEMPVRKSPATQYTCPMHPEVIRDEPGSCPICGMNLVAVTASEDEEDKHYKHLLKKFKIATLFTLPVLIIAMSEMIPGNPLYQWLDIRYWNWIQLILSIPVVFYATWMFFQRAWRSVVSRNPNMFTLIGIGAGVAWLFSVTGLLFPQLFPDQFKTSFGTVYVYFEAATVILTLVLLGQLLEARAHGKTSSAIRELLKLAPNNATRIVNGVEETVSVDAIEKGNLLRVRPGEKVPVDGTITEGDAVIDESMITGEPVPADKRAGDKVSSGTINGNKAFTMMAEKVGAETLLSRIIDMVNSASRSRAPVQNLADKISYYFVPAVVLVAIITFIIWAVFGPEPSYVYALVNAIAVLIIACPCALGLATPMSVMVGVGKGANIGVLIRNAENLEKFSRVDMLVVDKTGTLTEGKPSVEKVVSVHQAHNENDVLRKIVTVNGSSEHPLARATIKYGKEQNIIGGPVSDFEAITGKGVVARANGKTLLLGNAKLLQEYGVPLNEAVKSGVTEEQKSGKTVSLLAEDKEVLGYVVLSDKIKATSKEAVKALQAAGMQVVMFTGDNEATAKKVSEELGLDGYRAQMLPGDKLDEVRKLQLADRKVAMAGDGINDAPALSQADVGIAMGTGTDVAIESAGVTLVKGDLNGIIKARVLSRKVMRNIRQNLFFALGYNVLGIPVAAGVLYPFTGMLLSPMIAALAMSFSSVSVIANSLRLRTTAV